MVPGKQLCPLLAAFPWATRSLYSLSLSALLFLGPGHNQTSQLALAPTGRCTSIQSPFILFSAPLRPPLGLPINPVRGHRAEHRRGAQTCTPGALGFDCCFQPHLEVGMRGGSERTLGPGYLERQIYPKSPDTSLSPPELPFSLET